MKLDTAIEEFLTALVAERGLASNTVNAYRRDLAQYRRALAEHAITEVEAVATSDVTSYVQRLRDRGAAAATVGRKVAAVRGLHRFLVVEEYTDTDPTAMLDSPRRVTGLPKSLSVEAVTALLDSVDTGTDLGVRDRALLEFLYGTGARVSEAIGLDQIDLDLDEATALVTGKGSKQRLVPLGGYAVNALRDYYPVRRALIGAEHDPGAVFVSARGRRLTRQAVWQIMKKTAKTAGLEESRVSPHVLRHSAATHMVEGGADLRTVQELLGHANISTTQVYTRVSPQHLYEVYVTSHPRGR
jgi:integrase/recombinase XerD